jgi:hypothetical protein
LYFNEELKSVNSKGPRIKHVCRSAKSVLGKTPATFGNVDDKTEDLDDILSKLFLTIFFFQLNYLYYK